MSQKLIGYATYLEVRVSPVFKSNDINTLHEQVKNAMNDIPKLGNCSWIIEPDLRTVKPTGFDSFAEYEAYGDPY